MPIVPDGDTSAKFSFFLTQASPQTPKGSDALPSTLYGVSSQAAWTNSDRASPRLPSSRGPQPRASQEPNPLTELTSV